MIREKPRPGDAPGTGRVLIVEVKASRDQATIESEVASGRAVSREGRKALAVKRWENLSPDRLKYHLVYVTGPTATADQVREARSVFGNEAS